MKQFAQIILRSHLFIAICAVALCIETAVVVGADRQSPAFYVCILAATFATYNGYYWREPQFQQQRLLAIIGMLLACISFGFTAEISLLPLSITLLLSVFYMWPLFVFRPVIRLPGFLRVLLLTIIWFMVTWVIPLTNINISEYPIFLAAYRFVFLLLLCMIFFIRDEVNEATRTMAIHVTRMLYLFQVLLCLGVFQIMSGSLAAAYFFSTLILMLLSEYCIRKKPSHSIYLFAVDGLMLWQAIFVILTTRFYP
jgi:hypothetical protein